MAARGEGHFVILDVKARFGKQFQIAAMVVMHMADDDVFHIAGRNANGSQAFHRVGQKFASPTGAHFRFKASIEDVCSARTDNGPDEIIQRHGSVMGIAANEVGGRITLQMAIADRINLVRFGA